MHGKSHGPVVAATIFSRRYNIWLVAVMLAVNILNMADRQGLAAVAPAIKADLGLSDTQMGLIQGLGFAIFYSLMGLPLARLAESRSRVRLIGWSVGIFGAMVALCGATRSFASLLLCRIGVAIGDAGFGPPVGSLMGDHFPAHRRATVTTLIWLGAPIGAVIGSSVGGLIAQSAGWRSWFYLLAIPAILVAVTILLTLREPPRGLSDEQPPVDGPPPPMAVAIAFIWAKRSMRYVLIGAGFGAIALNGIGQFLARFLTAGMGLDYAQAGQTLGILSLVSMASGFALGGFGMDWAGRRDPRWYVLGPGFALIVSVPLLIAGFAQPTLARALPLLLFGQIAMFVFYTPTLALAQNMVDARMRASSTFLAVLVLGLVGTGLGPTITGMFSDHYSAAAFGPGFHGACDHHATALVSPACRAASATGIRRAMMTIPLFAALAGLCFLMAARTIVDDLKLRYAA